MLSMNRMITMLSVRSIHVNQISSKLRSEGTPSSTLTTKFEGTLMNTLLSMGKTCGTLKNTPRVTQVVTPDSWMRDAGQDLSTIYSELLTKKIGAHKN